MVALRSAIYEVVEHGRPMSVRQVFYQLVSQGVIEKTESEYKRTVGRLLTKMRRERVIPYGWISDSTRWMRKPTTYRSMESALEQMQKYYRRDLWADQDAYVEIWLEKDALAGVVFDVTEVWDVPLMVTRGYPSLSYLAGAAEAIADERRPCHLYYFGDRDPSGVDIPRSTKSQLRDLVETMVDNPPSITFDIVAVTESQIVSWNLPTRPTKQKDSRSANFKGDSVELDAIPPDDLRALVETCITQHIDQARLDRTREVEAAERESLASMILPFPREKGRW